MKKRIKFRRGDVVKLYSLQSFFGPGFYDGTNVYVKQDQYGGSVIVYVIDEKPMPGGTPRNRTSYEVYPEQLKLVKRSIPRSMEKVCPFIEDQKEELA